MPGDWNSGAILCCYDLQGCPMLPGLWGRNGVGLLCRDLESSAARPCYSVDLPRSCIARGNLQGNSCRTPAGGTYISSLNVASPISSSSPTRSSAVLSPSVVRAEEKERGSRASLRQTDLRQNATGISLRKVSVFNVAKRRPRRHKRRCRHGVSRQRSETFLANAGPRDRPARHCLPVTKPRPAASSILNTASTSASSSTDGIAASPRRAARTASSAWSRNCRGRSATERGRGCRGPSAPILLPLPAPAPRVSFPPPTEPLSLRSAAINPPPRRFPSARPPEGRTGTAVQQQRGEAVQQRGQPVPLQVLAALLLARRHGALLGARAATPPRRRPSRTSQTSEVPEEGGRSEADLGAGRGRRISARGRETACGAARLCFSGQQQKPARNTRRKADTCSVRAQQPQASVSVLL